MDALPATDSDIAPSILIVEDEAVVALDLKMQLQDIGYTVCDIVNNAVDAVSCAWKYRPSLILMDIVLKGDADGVNAAEQINRGLHIPVIFLTAYSDMNTVKRASHTAPYGYLTKPFRLQELHALIEVALYKATLERQLRESEKWFASTLRSVADAVIVTDERGMIRFMNPVASSMLEWQPEDALGRDISKVVMIERKDGSVTLSPAKRALQENKVTGLEFGSILVSREGHRLPIDDSAAPIKDENGRSLGAVIVFRSVQDRILAEERLRQSEERFRNMFNFAPVGMALVSLDKLFLQVNNAVGNLLGYTVDELIGVSQDRFSYVNEITAENEILQEILSRHSLSAQFEKRYKTKEGKTLWTLVSVSLLQQRNEPLCYLWQIQDVTERKDAEDRLAHLAHFDLLTGLANRAWLSEEIERQISLAKRHHSRFAVVFLDLDHFKQVNDSLGHEAGDELLQAIARKLKGTIREIDTAARLGGDEFVILLSEIEADEDVLVVTDKVRSECTRPVSVAGHEMRVGISFGVSMYPDDAHDARTLLRYADSALYHAKAEGRNNLQFYRPELMTRMQQKMTLEAGLRLALERREFELVYQPIVSLADGRPLMAEALIRWNHPTLGVLGPDTFIPLIEEMGLSSPIGSWVFHEACRAAKTWPLVHGKEIGVSINVSPKQFKSGDLVQPLKNALKETDLSPERICIEITEQVLLEENAHNKEIIAKLKELGIKIAIDDFGVGFSSLSYISRIAPSEIKIDRSLVQNIVSNHYDAAIIRATVAMAHSLDMSVVTEGVETADQEKMLKKELCDMAQGHLYASPRSTTNFCNWLTAH